MLKIQNLTVKFGENLVLNSVEAIFPEAQIHGIVGFNGSGKSTLFNTLLGYLTPNEGTVSFRGEKLEKGTIGFLPTQNFFYSYLKGKEYLDIFPNNLPEETYLILEKAIGLPLNELVEGYSSGMKKKLALLGILKLNREVYLLDEPFNGLDIESVFLVKKIAESLKKSGKTIFITSHIPETLVGICDSFHLIRNKKLELVSGETYSKTMQENFNAVFEAELEEKLRF